MSDRIMAGPIQVILRTLNKSKISEMWKEIMGISTAENTKSKLLPVGIYIKHNNGPSEKKTPTNSKH